MRTFLLACCLVMLGAALSPALAAAEIRPATWAQPLANDHLHNLFQVAPGLYRCAQPDAEGMQALERLGVKTVIDLRAFHNDQDELAGTKLLSEELSVKTWHLEDEDVIRVLRILRDPTRGPFAIHCQHGSDRTGVMCAMYRLTVDHWTREEAIREMTEGGYGFWPGWNNLVEYLRTVDLERIQAAVAAPSP
jgi:protein tyrosine/serine phosphatase